MSCKRNAFMMLIHADQERALTYLSTCIDQVNSFGDILQLVIVELIYKVGVTVGSSSVKIKHTPTLPHTCAHTHTHIHINWWWKTVQDITMPQSSISKSSSPISASFWYQGISFFHWTQVCHANPSERARFIRCIYNLLNSSSPAVRYEAAGTLVTLSSAPTAIKVRL